MCFCLKPFFVQYCTIQNDFGQLINSCNPVIGIAFFCKLKVKNWSGLDFEISDACISYDTLNL